MSFLQRIGEALGVTPRFGAGIPARRRAGTDIQKQDARSRGSVMRSGIRGLGQ